MQRSTGSGIGVEGHVQRHATDDRQFQVHHRHVETGTGGESCSIGDAVVDRGLALREEASRLMTGTGRSDTAVVGQAGNDPAMSGAAKAQLGRQGHIGEYIFNLRCFVVGDRDQEDRLTAVAAGIHCRVSHRGRTDLEETAREV